MYKKAIWIAACVTLLCGVDARGMDVSTPGVAHFSVKVKSLKETRFSTTMRQQYDFSCGSAALATLLTHHYNTPVTEMAIFEQMYLNGDQAKIRREGFSLLDMQRYLVRRGFKADGFELPLHKLIEAKLPAIVLVTEKGYNHFVVIKGAADGRILLGDPSSGTRSVSVEHMLEIWPNKLLFVIHDYPGAVAFNGSADWHAAPLAPLAQGIDRNALTTLTVFRRGDGDF